jgi:hypothetical protein
MYSSDPSYNATANEEKKGIPNQIHQTMHPNQIKERKNESKRRGIQTYPFGINFGIGGATASENSTASYDGEAITASQTCIPPATMPGHSQYRGRRNRWEWALFGWNR